MELWGVVGSCAPSILTRRNAEKSLFVLKQINFLGANGERPMGHEKDTCTCGLSNHTCPIHFIPGHFIPGHSRHTFTEVKQEIYISSFFQIYNISYKGQNPKS